MKVRKAIKTIAALGVGASFMGATLMGAMAADLSNYPGMFIQNGQFNGLLVVGEKADSIDTLGVTNIALGLQKAAVTKTVVCGTGSTGSTTVTGEKIDLSDDDLNLGDDLADVQDQITDSDLPNLLATAEFKDNQGANKENVEYDQTIDLSDGAGVFGYYQDDDEADPSGFYLQFPKSTPMYTYTLEFDSSVEFDDTEDLVSTSLEMQGKTYTITDVDLTVGDALEKLTLMSGESVMWIEQDQTVTKQVGGTSHSIKMVDVTDGEDSCGFDIDGTTIWINVDETETVNGVTIGVTEAKAVHTVNYDADICKVFIGADEIELDSSTSDGVSVGGDEVAGSEVTFDSAANTWDGMTIEYTPEDTTYLGVDDELVDPVFGNFKFIMGAVHADNEEIVFEASGDSGTLTFNNKDGKEIQLPITDDAGTFILGTEKDLTADPDAGYYRESEVCDGTDDATNCEGAHFLATDNDDVVHVFEIQDIDLTNSEITIKDVTTGSITTDAAFVEDASSEISLRGFERVNLTITGEDVTFDLLDYGVMMSENEGTVDVAGDVDALTGFTFEESAEAAAPATITVDLVDDDDDLNFVTPTSVPGFEDTVDKSDADSDIKIAYTLYGTLVEYDTDANQDVTITHPNEDLYADAFLAEVGARAAAVNGSGSGCVESVTQNPIPSTVNKLDSEVMSSYSTQNVISVGGPCANAVSAALLGNPEVCYAGFETGKAIIQLFEQGDKVAVVVAGGSGADTKAASAALQSYADYTLTGKKMLFTTSSMKVEPFVASTA